MGAPKGNKFWLKRTKHGRDKKFTPKTLHLACCEYFDWVEDNPLQEGKLFSYEGAIIEGTLNKLRAMTIGGMCNFLDICENTWASYREHKDFMQVVTRAERIMRDQKFTGAAAGLLNSNIIARDLGLVDKQDVDTSFTIKIGDKDAGSL